jgi:hypothetical protein
MNVGSVRCAEWLRLRYSSMEYTVALCPVQWNRNRSYNSDAATAGCHVVRLASCVLIALMMEAALITETSVASITLHHVQQLRT